MIVWLSTNQGFQYLTVIFNFRIWFTVVNKDKLGISSDVDPGQ